MLGKDICCNKLNGQDFLAVKENLVNRKTPRSTGCSSAFMLGLLEFPFLPSRLIEEAIHCST